LLAAARRGRALIIPAARRSRIGHYERVASGLDLSENENKVINIAGTVLPVVGLAVLIGSNLTHSWWFAIAYVAFVLVLIGAISAWIAQNHSMKATAVLMLPFRRRTSGT